MRRSEMNAWPRAKRAGFTLIEILVVMAIIGLLIGLLLPAVAKIREAGPRLRCKAEIADMGNAIEAFKSTYEVKYIPSVFILAHDYNPVPANGANWNAVLKDSRTYYSKVWPKAFVPNSPGITPTPTDPNGPYIVLDGNMCLVFFLGGVPMGNNAISPPNGFPGTWQGDRTSAGEVKGRIAGFNNSPTNPFNYVATNNAAYAPTSADVAKGPFFDFKVERLDSLNHYHDVYWDGQDTTKSIYYYFSSKEGNDYDFFGNYRYFYPDPTNAPIKVTGGYGDPNNPSGTTYMGPMIGVDGKYMNSGKYQIISAGRDTIPGDGSIKGQAGTYWPGVYAKGKPGGGDDLSNFAQYLLGGDE
jgi:prepilin-type N-terminal cleavage/methylation domain-containing protein